jgi:hypothetical protein
MRLPLTVLRPSAASLPLDRADMLRLLGYKPGVTRLEPRHEALLEKGIAMAVEAAAPAVSLGYCAVMVQQDEVMTRIPGLVWRSKMLARLLKGGLGVSLVAATLGPGIEELTARLFAEEEYALATIVDAAASTLVHGLSNCVTGYLTDQIQGLALTPLYGPGYGDWDIHDQLTLVTEAGGPAIGLTSNDACYLYPQKSLVGIVGWVAPDTPGRKPLATACTLCAMRECAYRVRQTG